MNLERIDHVVFTVESIERTCEFYQRVLETPVITFDAGRIALQIGQSRVNLHQVGSELEPRARHAGPGTQDVCFITTEPIDAVAARLRTNGAAVIEGPVARTGARGAMESVYIRDPDGNLVEIAQYVYDSP